MKVCFFGMYAPNYSRNRVLLKGLHQNSVDIVECNDRHHLLWGFRYFRLLLKFFKVRGWSCDLIFVGFPGQTDVPLAWVLGKLFNKKIIFDAFYSLYVSQVFDRKHVNNISIRSCLYFFADWLSCWLADKVVLDTNTHVNYFVRTFHLPREKFSRVFVGTDTDAIKPTKVDSHKGIIIGFHGSYLPLQGVPIILRAAKLLEKEDLRFKLLGNGIELEKCKKLSYELKLHNVEFLKEISYTELAPFISGTDIYLGGHFASSLKSNLVIANKVFEAMACRKATIVGESDAAKELFEDGKQCLLVRQGNPEDLAKVILLLCKNKSMREKIAKEGYNLVVNRLRPKLVVKDLIAILK